MKAILKITIRLLIKLITFELLARNFSPFQNIAKILYAQRGYFRFSKTTPMQNEWVSKNSIF